MRGRLLILLSVLLCVATSKIYGDKGEIDDKPVDESAEDEDQTAKGSINSLNLNEKVEIDDKNPTLKELQKKIEETLKKKKEEMKEEEKKKSDDKVVDLKPKKDDECKEADEKKKEEKEKEKDKNKEKKDD